MHSDSRFLVRIRKGQLNFRYYTCLGRNTLTCPPAGHYTKPFYWLNTHLIPTLRRSRMHVAFCVGFTNAGVDQFALGCATRSTPLGCRGRNLNAYLTHCQSLHSLTVSAIEVLRETLSGFEANLRSFRSQAPFYRSSVAQCRLLHTRSIKVKYAKQIRRAEQSTYSD